MPEPEQTPGRGVRPGDEGSLRASARVGRGAPRPDARGRVGGRGPLSGPLAAHAGLHPRQRPRGAPARGRRSGPDREGTACDHHRGGARRPGIAAVRAAVRGRDRRRDARVRGAGARPGHGPPQHPPGGPGGGGEGLPPPPSGAHARRGAAQRCPRRAPRQPGDGETAPGGRRAAGAVRAPPALRAGRRGGPRQDHRGGDGLLRPPPLRPRGAGAGHRAEPPDRAVARRAVPQVPAALHPGRRRAAGPEPPRRSGHLALAEVLPRDHQPRAPLALTRGGRRGRGRGLGPGHRRRGTPPPGREGLRCHRGARTENVGAPAAHRHADAARPGRVPRPAQAARPGDRARLRGVSCPPAAAGGAVSDGPRPARGRRRRDRRGGHRAPVTFSGRHGAGQAARPRGAAHPPRRDLQPLRGAGSQSPCPRGRVQRAPPPPTRGRATRHGAPRPRRGARRGARGFGPGRGAGRSAPPARFLAGSVRPGCGRRARRPAGAPCEGREVPGTPRAPGRRLGGRARRQGAPLHRGARHAGEPPRAALGRWHRGAGVPRRSPAGGPRPPGGPLPRPGGAASCSAPRLAARAATSSSRTTS